MGIMEGEGLNEKSLYVSCHFPANFNSSKILNLLSFKICILQTENNIRIKGE